MRTPEQRMSDALADLEAMLDERTHIDQALEKSAKSYGFRPDVLKARAEKVLGDLATYKERSARKAELTTREHRVDTAIDLYLVEQPDADYPTWFEKRVGRPPTKVESGEFSKRYAEFLLKDIRCEL